MNPAGPDAQRCRCIEHVAKRKTRILDGRDLAPVCKNEYDRRRPVIRIDILSQTAAFMAESFLKVSLSWTTTKRADCWFAPLGAYIPASRIAFSSSSLICSGGDVGRIEINEAFAAIVLAVTKDLGLSPDIVNVEGGAIAHGHPIGASGAVLTTRLLHSMQRDGINKGVVTLCIGGGQGIALALEAIA